MTLGHEFCGLVEKVGEGVTSFVGSELVTVDPNIACGTCPACRRGRPNLCANLTAIGVTRDGGFAEYVVVPCGQAFILPADLDPVHGAFCEPLACCIHAIDKAQIRPGDSVAILGGGVIGLLMVQLARLAGADQIILITRQLHGGKQLCAWVQHRPSIRRRPMPLLPCGMLPAGASMSS